MGGEDRGGQIKPKRMRPVVVVYKLCSYQDIEEK